MEKMVEILSLVKNRLESVEEHTWVETDFGPTFTFNSIAYFNDVKYVTHFVDSIIMLLTDREKYESDTVKLELKFRELSLEADKKFFAGKIFKEMEAIQYEVEDRKRLLNFLETLEKGKSK